MGLGPRPGPGRPIPILKEEEECPSVVFSPLLILHTTRSSAPVPWWRDLGRSPPALDGLDEALVLLGPGSKLAGDMIISTISSLIFH